MISDNEFDVLTASYPLISKVNIKIQKHIKEDLNSNECILKIIKLRFGKKIGCLILTENNFRIYWINDFVIIKFPKVIKINFQQIAKIKVVDNLTLKVNTVLKEEINISFKYIKDQKYFHEFITINSPRLN
ncbi:hypothetical protein [Aureivirga sp. CE67]|uniref:hypothetical protein n=1 Tax=Aureivirga sp. CE67 TaxID=1788983 RepID=UPI0018CB0526|nr:hypothetical protein [Aureivirga sp. CE67]